MVVQIVESLNEGHYQRHAAKIQTAIVKFLHFYTEFSSSFETYIVSQTITVSQGQKKTFQPERLKE